MQEHHSKKDTYSYKGWLTSDNFFKRAFAVLGYSVVAQFFLSLFLFAILIFIKFLGASI